MCEMFLIALVMSMTGPTAVLVSEPQEFKDCKSCAEVAILINDDEEDPKTAICGTIPKTEKEEKPEGLERTRS